MFEPVTRNVFRWVVTDPEFGEEMSGHLLIKGDSCVLIDPPATAKLIEMVKTMGKPEAVIMTNYSHKRGSAHIASVLSVPLYIPARKGQSDQDLSMFGLSSGKQYDENTELPLGIRAHRLRSEMEDGKTAMDEMALLFDSFLIVGDSAWGVNGRLNIFPAGIMPDEGGRRAAAIGKELRSVVRKTGASGLLSGHGEDIKTGLQAMFS